MNHKELLTELASRMKAPQSVIEDLLEITVSICIEQLKDDKIVGFQSFGNFEVRKKDERLSVHPSTQLRTLIPPKLVLSFKQSTVLKEKLKYLPHYE